MLNAMKKSALHIARKILIAGGTLFIQHLLAQSPYKIDISANIKEQHSSGFLKMGTGTSSNGDVLSYDNTYLIKNGKPWYPVMGEFHFSRVPNQHWEEELLKMKSCGIQIISTYIMWNYVENKEGVFDWSGNNNLKKFLSVCRKLHLYVWLRPGPWIHAEVRNGGFPDWLIRKHLLLRTTDSAYLKYVNIFFKQIALQCNGFWFKENGPVIGVQLENEFVFKKLTAYAYMKQLKSIAIDAGMDVPYYAVFAQGPDDQNDFLYMIGSYPDSPWNQGTQKLFKPVFFIRPLEADQDIGSDLFGKVDAKVHNTYPKLSAEIGGGMQPTYHRRIKVNADDIASNLLTKIAGGLNGVGYYMFHGGINPVFATTMQESRLTGYPNDLPLINYDFEAPVGAMGNISETFRDLKLINLFLDDFGSRVAQTSAYFPEVRKRSVFSCDTVQCSLRVDSKGQGFIFLNNYQRYVHQPEVKKFQLRINNQNTKERIPGKPMTFPADDYAIWPYHLLLKNVLLDYATAQPFCSIQSGNESDYFFVSDGETEFCFDANTINACKPLTNCDAKSETTKIYIHCKANKIAALDIVSKTNEHIRFIILPKKEALNAYKATVGEQEVLMISKGVVYANSGKLYIQKTKEDQQDNSLKVYPNVSLTPLQKQVSIKKAGSIFPFTDYKINIDENISGTVAVNEINTVQADAASYQDSILKLYSKSKEFKSSQRGPLYQIHFHDLPNQKKYSIRYNLPLDNVIKSWQMNFDYRGDVMALYDSAKVVYDQFNYDNHCDFSPTYLLNKNKGELLLQVLPGYEGMKVFWEDSMNFGPGQYPSRAVLKSVTVEPVYTLEFVSSR